MKRVAMSLKKTNLKNNRMVRASRNKKSKKVEDGEEQARATDQSEESQDQ